MTTRYVLPPLDWEPTRNYSSRRGITADLVVVHRWAGGSYPGVLSWFRNTDADVSSHIVYAGTVGSYANKCAQMVKKRNSAWTQEAYNKRSISIECADAMWLPKPGATPDAPRWTQLLDPEGLRVTARIVAWCCWKYGIPARWVRGTSIGTPGVTRHYDLPEHGRDHNDHTDPTLDQTLWLEFIGHVKAELARGSFRTTWLAY